MTTRYYLQIIGPYDSTFVGPFHNLAAAQLYARSVDRSIFDAYLMNEAAFRANVAEYGVAHLTLAEGNLQ